MIKYTQAAVVFKSHQMSLHDALLMYKDLVNLLFDESETDQLLNYSADDMTTLITESANHAILFSDKDGSNKIYNATVSNVFNYQDTVFLRFSRRIRNYYFIVYIIGHDEKFATGIGIVHPAMELSSDPFEDYRNRNEFAKITYDCDFAKMGYEFFKNNGIRFFEMIENNKLYLISMSAYFSTEEDVVINNEKEN